MLRKIIKIVTLVHLCIVLVAILIVGIWCACNWSWIVDQFTMDHHGVSIEMGNRREQMRQYLLDQGYEPENLCLTAEEYRSAVLFPFFDGLIPEGWLLDVASRNWKLDRNDRFSLLLLCCNGCIGDVSVREAAR